MGVLLAEIENDSQSYIQRMSFKERLQRSTETDFRRACPDRGKPGGSKGTSNGSECSGLGLRFRH